MFTVMVDEASELTSEQSAKILKEELIEHLKLIKTNFSDGYVAGACSGKTTIHHPKWVEWEEGRFCWQIGDNFLCSDKFMEALKYANPVKSKGFDIDKHGFMLDDATEFFEAGLSEMMKDKETPKKIHKPKHTPPFWANNWRKK
jgi:hypothetical protein